MKDIFLLDMDDTLLDFKRAERENLLTTLRRCSIPVNEDTHPRFHEINDRLWKALERGEITRERLLVRRFELLLADMGRGESAERVAKAYFDNFPFICFPYAGAVEFLAELSRRGRVYIVTNGSAVIQNRHITDAGFSPYLAGVFISEEVGANKPSKAFANAVAEGISGYQKERAVWLGDSLTSDMGCAKAAEVDFVLFSPAGKPQDYDGLCAADYQEALDIFSRL